VLCVSLAERSVKDVVLALRGRSFAEIRLDAVRDLSEAGIKSIFAGPGRRIAAFRPGLADDSSRFRFLLQAVQAGAAYVDIEIESLGKEARALIREAKRRGCRVIISYHNTRRTPPRADLLRTRNRAFAAGADVAKIACRCRGRKDNARLLGLLDDSRPTIAIGMGAKGVITRIVAPWLGAPFTFAAPERGRETAPGQLPASTLSKVWSGFEHV
jgi:3-dehydroquinate dehydratase type I